MSELRLVAGRDAKQPHPFTGDALLGLLSRPKPAPMEPGIPPLGHLTLEVSAPMVGKTSRTLVQAAACAAGRAPWVGATAEPPADALIISADEGAEQIVRRIDELGRAQGIGELATYAERVHVVAPDRDADPSILEGLRLTPAGIARLTGMLESGAVLGRPYRMMSIDAWSDFLPFGVSENDVADAARIGGALEALAVRFDMRVIVLHHSGKLPPDSSSEIDMRRLVRGASSIAAKARTIIALEEVPGSPHLRRVRTLTNLGRAPKPTLFEVCDPGDVDGAVVRFTPVRERDALERPPETLLKAGELISTSELARRLAGGREPGAHHKTQAASLRGRWARAGIVRVVDGKRSAKMIELVADELEGRSDDLF